MTIVIDGISSRTLQKLLFAHWCVPKGFVWLRNFQCLWSKLWSHSAAQEGNSRFTLSFCSSRRWGVSCLPWPRWECTDQLSWFSSVLLKIPGKALHVPKPRASDIQWCKEWMLDHYSAFRSAASTQLMMIFLFPPSLKIQWQNNTRADALYSSIYLRRSRFKSSEKISLNP